MVSQMLINQQFIIPATCERQLHMRVFILKEEGSKIGHQGVLEVVAPIFFSGMAITPHSLDSYALLLLLVN